MENEKKTREGMIEFLQENIVFPCKVSFLLMKDQDGSVELLSTPLKTNTKLENLKYKQVTGATWTAEGSAVLSVKEFTTAEEYLEETERLDKIWGFALRKIQNEEGVKEHGQTI